MKKSALSFCCIFVFTLACSSLGAQDAAQATLAASARAENATPPANDNAQREGFSVRNPRYRLNLSDTLQISFALSPEFNQKVAVGPDGFISLQSAGTVYVLGLTVPETVEAIKKAYATTLHDPIVDVDLIDFQKPFFVVNGQVGKPGQYDLRYNLTVTEAVALAGGFLSTAKSRVYLYHRADTGWVEAKEINLNDFLRGKNVAEDVGVRPGDMIFVPEKSITKIRKYIPYGLGLGSGVYY
jgi:polysaccharide biosynthesis/export protein